VSGYDDAIYLSYLAQVPMLHACNEEQRQHIASRAEARQVADGDDIVVEGQTGDEFYVLASGHATVTRGGTTVATLDPGAFFGELALFDPAPRNATVTAKGPVTVVALHRDEFQELLGEVPALRDSLLRGMARRLHELDATA
jgi:cAMP-dependent protein kinase regulator